MANRWSKLASSVIQVSLKLMYSPRYWPSNSSLRQVTPVLDQLWCKESGPRFAKVWRRDNLALRNLWMAPHLNMLKVDIIDNFIFDGNVQLGQVLDEGSFNLIGHLELELTLRLVCCKRWKNWSKSALKYLTTFCMNLSGSLCFKISY